MSTAIACRKELVQRLGVPSAAQCVFFYIQKTCTWVLIMCSTTWPRVESNEGSPTVGEI